MKINIVIKLLISIVMVMSIVCVNCGYVNATGSNTYTYQDPNLMTEEQKSEMGNKNISDIIDAGNKFIGIGKKAEEENPDISINAFVSQLIDIGQILVAIGGGALLIITAIMAIKWITATPDKQAKLKTQLIGLAIATIVIFGAVGIWSFIKNIMFDVEGILEEGTNKYEIVEYING